MPVYHLTFHAYRSWRPDHPKGYVKRNRGILPPDAQMAQWYDEAATQTPVRFEHEHQQILLNGVLDIAGRRGWRVHAIAIEQTHVHILVSWSDDTDVDWKHVQDTFKQLLGMMLSRHFEQKGRKWFSRKGSRKRVRDREHLEYLITTYLPSHRGLFWSEHDS